MQQTKAPLVLHSSRMPGCTPTFYGTLKLYGTVAQIWAPVRGSDKGGFAHQASSRQKSRRVRRHQRRRPRRMHRIKG